MADLVQKFSRMELGSNPLLTVVNIERLFFFLFRPFNNLALINAL